MNVVKKDVVIDSGLNPIQLATEATNLTSGNIDFYTLPIVGYATEGGQDVNLVDPAKLQAEVATLFSDHKSSTAPARPQKPADAAHEVVDVYNGSNTQGLAAAVIIGRATRVCLRASGCSQHGTEGDKKTIVSDADSRAATCRRSRLVALAVPVLLARAASASRGSASASCYQSGVGMAAVTSAGE